MAEVPKARPMVTRAGISAVSKMDQPQGQQQQGGADAAEPTKIYTFPSVPPDSDSIQSELEEFYSYVEVPQVLEHKASFLESWLNPATDFVEAPEDLKLQHITMLLDGLSAFDAEHRCTCARNVLYIAQGTFTARATPEQHLHRIAVNVKLLRKAGALERVWEAVKGTTLRWEGVSSMSDVEMSRSSGPGGQGVRSFSSNSSVQDRLEYLEETNAELAIHLAILYFMVESIRNDPDLGAQFGQELMALEPPMPIYLFNLVAGLRDKNAKGYPVKKLLLLLWKSLLCCIGGHKDITRTKKLVRHIEGLPKDSKREPNAHRPYTKAAPTDLQSFRNEISFKYPTYVPPPLPAVDVDRISAASAPTPVKVSFAYHVDSNGQGKEGDRGVQEWSNSRPVGDGWGPNTQNAQGPGGAGGVGPGTPAPSPPSSPMPKKKQQYQTDQSRPFVLPFSRANEAPAGRPTRVVPRSIEEAGGLYMSHMRISTELWQTWKLREEYIADETGISRAAEAEQDSGPSTDPIKDGLKQAVQRLSALSIEDDDEADEAEAQEDAGNVSSESEDEDVHDPLTLLRDMGKKLRGEEERAKDDKKRTELQLKRQDILRLERIEMLYRAILPQMQSAVIVLLKLLLATVTNATPMPPANGQNGDQQPPQDTSPQTLEDVDILRHREITSKAVSGILILTLRWFKTSHAMKFQYLSQLLVDSNCLLLILKMFGIQEVTHSVQSKNEDEEYNFFRYCHLYGASENSPLHIPDESPDPPPATTALADTTKAVTEPSTTEPADAPVAENARPENPEDEGCELVTEYSWRNFFSAINFVHILQKLTKRKTHRILLLVQYKSSAILKRILKVSHPALRIYVLKIIKSQVPYCGRKWRQSNMKVITSIYLNCRPDLRDEWLTGVDIDADVEESLPSEQALRALVKFFNTKHYGAYAPSLHRRSSSQAGPAPEFGSAIPPPSPGSGYADNDVFPPTRPPHSFNANTSFRAAYGHDVSGEEYADYEVDDLLFNSLDSDQLLDGDLSSANIAWGHLSDLLGDYDDISDSESIASFGLLDFGGDDESIDESVSDFDEGSDEWGRINPDTITALEEERDSTLPHSPRPRGRRSSSGPISPALRPILFDRDDDAQDSSEPMLGPAPTAPHKGPSVDEVELIFGE